MEINLCWVGAATVVVNINNELKFACDPALVKQDSIIKFKAFDGKRIIGPVYDKDTFNNIDLWFLTHGHLDHIDQEGKSVIDKNAKLICCENVNLILQDERYIDKVILKWNDSYSLNIKGYQIKIKTIAGYHGNNFIMRKALGKINSYLIEIERNNEIRTFYISSDTVYDNKIIKKLKHINIDYFIANLGQAMSEKFGGPITMSVDMLNRFCRELTIGKVIPVHINDFSHYETTEEEVINSGYQVIERGKWLLID
jgi:L-ascorbate metabolism protein UlaG (beta-lactamase superfamily)